LVAGDGVAWLDADGEAVKRWSVFDRPADFPLDDFGPCGCHEGFWGDGTIDFTHGNNVDPRTDEGAIVISLRNLSRVVKLDVDSGDVIWQLGEGGDFTWIGDEPAGERWFTDQHDAHFLPNGNLALFDNGNCRAGNEDPYSRAVELAVDQTNMTVSLVWQHRVPYAGAMGNVVRMDDGNTFISGGWNGQLVEAAPNGDEIWRLQYPVVMQLPNISHGLLLPAPWVYGRDAP
jgi:outer membrane protein assembly factor BamB